MKALPIVGIKLNKLWLARVPIERRITMEREMRLLLLFLLLLALGSFWACSSPQVAVDKVQVVYSGNMWGYLEPCPT